VSIAPEVSTVTEVSKPTPADLGIDLEAQEWLRSGTGDGSIELAFPVAAPGAVVSWKPGDWVLMRVAGDDPNELVLVFDRNEWDCFLDGVRNGEFDDAALT
jgi:hypothetical protein